MPWENKEDPYNNLLRKIINHQDFWNESKEEYLQLYPRKRFRNNIK